MLAPCCTAAVYGQACTCRYGRVKIGKLRAAVNAHRAAVRAGSPEAIETTWDRLEPWLDRIFTAEAD